MIPEEHLPFFITEQLYILDDDQPVAPPATPEPASTPQDPVNVASEPEPEIVQTLESEVIVIHEPCSAEEMELLKKILSAVKVNLDQVLMIEGEPSNPLKYRRLIIFGQITSESAGNALYDTGNSSWLRSANLSTLAQSQEEKMRLWNALKTWFGFA